jgi:DNA polymerase-3 subunit gamma/tau
MSHQVLARKWRPKNFPTIVGQQHVVRALSNALKQNRLHHAYLFTGTRGVGKTTIARIIAKCFNCETGPTATPCGTCQHCVEIDSGTCIDLLEVDAASRTKVEDTRDLLDNVQYAPSKARFKIYLIDEVHMLSGHSFNALLKTLEEPPAHVKFLLATTDPQKLPITVLSRCLQFHLKHLQPEEISHYLSTVLAAENITTEEGALREIAQAAHGSMRDALSLLDQAIAFGEGSIQQADVNNMLGNVELVHLYALLDALADKNTNALHATLHNLATLSLDYQNALEHLLSILHQTSLTQLLPTETNLDDYYNQTHISHYAKNFSKETVQLYYQIGLIGRRDLMLAPTARIGFEMIILRMLAFQPSQAAPIRLQDLVNSNSQQQMSNQAASNVTHSTTAIAATTSHSTNDTTPPSASNTTNTTLNNTKTNSIPFEDALQNWSTLLPRLGLTGVTQALASHCRVIAFDQNSIRLEAESSQQNLLGEKHQQRIAEALDKQFGKTLRVEINIAGEAVVSTPKPTDTSLQSATPATLAKQHQAQQQQNAEQSIQSDPNVQSLLKQFNGKIIADSVRQADSETPKT